MMYENYRSVKRKDTDEDVQESLRMPANFPNNKRHATDPFTTNFNDFDEAVKAPQFSPPAYIQRYSAVQKVLADPRYRGKIKKVIDFGCSELGFLTHLKNTLGIEEILCVDVDRDTLEIHKKKAVPLNADYLHNRPTPLSIHVYEGSVTHRDKKLGNSDAVVAIELIEHLYPDTLMEFPYNVFGYIKPLVAVFTTPNADFNVLFPLTGNEFRHWDHKFEWTRQQFEDWANNIVSRYPAYEVSFQGIAEGPAGTEHLGCCSQMAIFYRNHEVESLPIYGIEGLLKSVTSQEFPFRVDNRSDEQKILDEASYYIRLFTVNNPECLEEFPLKSLLQYLNKFSISAETLREILENGGYAIIDREEGPAIVCPAVSTFSDYEDELANEENDIEEGNWETEYIRENSPYHENLGTWSENNVENMYDESWDDDYEIPAPNHHSNEETCDTTDPINNIALETEFLVTRSLDSTDFNGIEISNVSHVPSVPESIATDALPLFLESFESAEGNTRDSVKDSKNPAHIENQNQNQSVECKTEAVNTSTYESSASLNRIEDSSVSPKAKNPQEFPIRPDDTLELGSLCSIYLESSRNEDRDECPENITNPNFDCASLVCSFEKSRNSVDEKLSAESLYPKRLSTASVFGSDSLIQPQFASSPRVSLEYRENRETQKSSCSEDVADCLKSVSQTSLHSNGNISNPTTTSSGSSLSTIRKFYPPEENFLYKNVDSVKLKGGNDMADEPVEEFNSETGEISSCESFTANNSQEEFELTQMARQKSLESVELKNTTYSKKSEEENSLCKNVDLVKLNERNGRPNQPVDELNSESREISLCESSTTNNAQEEFKLTRMARQKALESLDLRSATCSKNVEEKNSRTNVNSVKLKGENEMVDEPVEEFNSESREISSSESLMANNAQENLELTQMARQKALESLELISTTCSKNSVKPLSTLRTTITSSSKKSLTENAQNNDLIARVQISSYVDSIVRTADENVAGSAYKSKCGKIDEYNRSRIAETSETVEAKSATPDAPETPPNSWSPEIMDSGYPNSASTQDMTPEYDLSSISQDRISDSESPSIAEPPRLGFHDHADVQNGDLANNNRDDEGNNMMAENENDLEDDLQPLIDVLEDDLENENDIYAVENDFPVWLLRILERGNNAGRRAIAEQINHDDYIGADVNAAGDAGMPDDEGFDSTSSEEDNGEEISTESSEEAIGWNASGDY